MPTNPTDPPLPDYLDAAASMKTDIESAINTLGATCHQLAVAKGWYENAPSFSDKVLMMHAELSEAAEAYRIGNPPSEKIPEFSSVEEEMADTVIRILDFASHGNLRLAEAITAKLEYNAGRPHRHGGKIL